MSTPCQALTSKGAPCKNKVKNGSFCRSHVPSPKAATTSSPTAVSEFKFEVIQNELEVEIPFTIAHHYDEHGVQVDYIDPRDGHGTPKTITDAMYRTRIFPGEFVTIKFPTKNAPLSVGSNLGSLVLPILAWMTFTNIDEQYPAMRVKFIRNTPKDPWIVNLTAV